MSRAAQKSDAEIANLRKRLYRYAEQVPPEDRWLTGAVTYARFANAQVCQAALKEDLQKLLTALDYIEDERVKKNAYNALDAVVLEASALRALIAEDPMEFYQKREEMSEDTELARASRAATKEMRVRRERMRPFVEKTAPKLRSIPTNKRVLAIRDELLRNEEFCRLLPKKLKDPRYLTSDIAAIIATPNGFKRMTEEDLVSLSDDSVPPVFVNDQFLKETMEAIVFDGEIPR
jgi:hypothetical protein